MAPVWTSSMWLKTWMNKMHIEKDLWVLLGLLGTLLETTALFSLLLDRGEGEFRAHVWKDHSCCNQQLLSGATCFSRESRPTEKGCQAPGITPGDVCQPYAWPAAGTSAAGKEWLQCWGWDRETLSFKAAFWLTAQLTPGQVKSWSQRRRGSGLPPLCIAADRFDVKHPSRLIKVTPRDTEQKMWLRGKTRSDTSGN